MTPLQFAGRRLRSVALDRCEGGTLEPHRPSDVFLAENGDAAIIERTNDCRGLRVHLFRSDGSIQAIPSPSVNTIAKALALRSTPQNLKNVAWSIDNIVLSREGKPYVTISSSFSGAYTGSVRSVLELNESGWTSRPVSFHKAADEAWPSNASVATTFRDDQFVANSDYDNAVQPDLDRLGRDSSYWHAEAAIVKTDQSQDLDGHVLASQGPYIVGYSARYGLDTVPTSVQWNDLRKRTLGRGVAFGTDVNGDAVGDDRVSLRALGHPWLWQSDGSRSLCNTHGSAKFIRNGEIVGEQPRGAFIIKNYLQSPKCVMLDRLVPYGWKIETAFQISARGTILAYGSYRGAEKSYLLLHPTDRPFRKIGVIKNS